MSAIPGARAVTVPRVLLLVVVVVAVALALPAFAPVAEVEPSNLTTASDSAPLPPSDPAALALLQHSAAVESSRSWQGSEVIAVVGSTASTASTVIADVEHRALVGSELTVVGGTQPLGMRAYSPDSVTFVGSSPLSSPMPEIADDAGWTAQLVKSFVVSDVGGDEIAGQLCQQIVIRRVNGATAAKVWVSQVNGLPLQRQVFDTQGELMRYSTFTKVSLVDDDDVDDVRADMRAAAPEPASASAGRSLSQAQLSALQAGGWTVPAQLGDVLSLVDAQVFGAALEPADSTGTLQLTYSDGLSTLSISEQRGHLASKLPAGWVSQIRSGSRVQVREATPLRVAWTASGRVFSIVSDTDDATVDLALTALPRPAVDTGYGPRMRRGLDRIGRWLTPTG